MRERVYCLWRISIHAPRTGSDSSVREVRPLNHDFNPRSPHGERRGHDGRGGSRGGFQSTLPARGATTSASQRVQAASYFNPRSPHGERRASVWARRYFTANFNPRSPHGERRFSASSIVSRRAYFNPRSPHGERRTCSTPWSGSATEFQSTLPARGATGSASAIIENFQNISIHAPRTGSDSAE